MKIINSRKRGPAWAGKNKSGFTLVEIIVAIGIFVLFNAVIVQIFLTAFKSTNIVFNQLDAQRQGRKVLQDFVAEMRSASYSSIGAFPVEEASSTEVIFYSNIDNDSYIERVRYSLSGRELIKGITEPTSSPLTYNTAFEATSTVVDILNNGTSSLFYYYDGDFAVTSTPPLSYPIDLAKVRVVSMNLRIDKAHPVRRSCSCSRPRWSCEI